MQGLQRLERLRAHDVSMIVSFADESEVGEIVLLLLIATRDVLRTGFALNDSKHASANCKAPDTNLARILRVGPFGFKLHRQSVASSSKSQQRTGLACSGGDAIAGSRVNIGSKLLTSFAC